MILNMPSLRRESNTLRGHPSTPPQAQGPGSSTAWPEVLNNRAAAAEGLHVSTARERKRRACSRQRAQKSRQLSSLVQLTLIVLGNYVGQVAQRLAEHALVHEVRVVVHVSADTVQVHEAVMRPGERVGNARVVAEREE